MRELPGTQGIVYMMAIASVFVNKKLLVIGGNNFDALVSRYRGRTSQNKKERAKNETRAIRH